MAKSPPPLGDPRATATAHRDNVAALRAVARAERRRAETLRVVGEAYLAEADREQRERAAQLLRDFAGHASALASIVDAEARGHDREAERVELAAQRADARAHVSAAVAADVRPKRSRR